MPVTETIPLTSAPALSAKKSEWAHVDEQGRLVLPPAMAAKLGLVPGARLRVEEATNSLRLHRPLNHLAKIYVEPTDACNIECVTCFRNNWDEPMGRMSEATFGAILEGLARLDPVPTVYFGGIGEPLVHRRTIEWVAKAKQLGARVEMITNGTMLDEQRSRALIEAGLDLLWVSIDGASPESYADVRLGAELPTVIANLERFKRLRVLINGNISWHTPKPELGIAFVAMRRNIADLPAVLHLARRLGAMHFSVSNVLPVTEDLQEERLYTKSLRSLTYIPSSQVPRLSLPKMDFNELTQDALVQAFNSGCWPLMHSHTSYLHGKVRHSQRHIIGNVRERGLLDLWLDPEYVGYRERVQSFAFPPCTFCGGCDMSESNVDDCFGNEFPACGGCLWAQGVVQCP